MRRFFVFGLLLTVVALPSAGVRGQVVLPPPPPPVIPVMPVLPPPPPPIIPVVPVQPTLPPLSQPAATGRLEAGPAAAEPIRRDPAPPPPSADSSFWFGGPLLVIAALLAAVGVAAAARRRSTSGGLIRIVAPPPGEAPEQVRAAWVGVELPLVGGMSQPCAALGLGAVSLGAAGVCAGYVVDGREAVARLATQCPEAAAWWRENAPHVLGRGYQLMFPADVCHRLG